MRNSSKETTDWIANEIRASSNHDPGTSIVLSVPTVNQKSSVTDFIFATQPERESRLFQDPV
jgi:hypothetical protein